jgi:hypothetical protein
MKRPASDAKRAIRRVKRMSSLQDHSLKTHAINFSIDIYF